MSINVNEMIITRKMVENEPRRAITAILVEYFDDLGEFIAAAKHSGIDIGYSDYNPAYVNNMKDMALTSMDLMGSFNCGRSSDVWKQLTGEENGTTYSKYISYIAKLLETTVLRV